MEEPLHPTAPQPQPEHHLAPRRIKRRLMALLITLYAAGVVAAIVLVLRAPDMPKKKGEVDGQQSLLSLAGGQKDAVGWVTINGPIYASEGGRPWDKGADQWSRRIRTLAEQKDVKAIVLDINSPGGSVGAVQEIYSNILRVRREKRIPVVAIFGDVAASGGYYIAAACDKVIAHPGSLTGSIGVIFSVTNFEGLLSKIGVKADPIKSGKHKDIGSPTRPMTPEERKILQSLIDDAYSQFVVAISTGRGLPEEKVRELADGRIYSGRQALDAGLVDALGDSQDALELAAKLGGIRGKPRVKRDGDGLGDFLQLLDSRMSLSSALGAFRPHGPLLEYRWEP
jgi:protease-4